MRLFLACDCTLLYVRIFCVPTKKGILEYECSVVGFPPNTTIIHTHTAHISLPTHTHDTHTRHTHAHWRLHTSTHVYTGAFDVKRGLIRKSSERTGGIYINPAPVLGGLALPKRQWTLDLWMNLGTERTPRAKSSSGCVCNIQYSQHLHVMMALILLSNTVCSLSFYFSSP